MLFTRIATLLYGGLTLAAFSWTWVQGRTFPWQLERELNDPNTFKVVLLSVACGLAFGQLMVWLTRILVRYVKWAQILHFEMRKLLGPLPSQHVLYLALISGVAEELFFRGALQPVVGLSVASLIFGALHIGPDRRFLPWTLWAIAMGFAFGALFEYSTLLWGSISAHVWINYWNMRFLLSHDPEKTASS